MNAIKTIYNLLGINRKIPYQPVRVKYLRDVWGIEQTVIGECEGMSQSQISKILYQTRLVPKEDMNNLVEQIMFQPSEIEMLQRLPREIILDAQLIAFVNNILKLDVQHPFYIRNTLGPNIRIAALSSLGVQSKHLEKLFNRKQSSISMIIKRSMDRANNVEHYYRYEFFLPLTIGSLPYRFLGVSRVENMQMEEM